MLYNDFTPNRNEAIEIEMLEVKLEESLLGDHISGAC